MNSIDNPLYKTLVQLGVKSDEARDAVESTHGGNLELLNYKFDSLDRRMNTFDMDGIARRWFECDYLDCDYLDCDSSGVAKFVEILLKKDSWKEKEISNNELARMIAEGFVSVDG